MALAEHDIPQDVDANVRRMVWALMGYHRVDSGSLAVKLGIARSSLSERLNGKRRFTVAELADLGRIFGVDPGMFFRDPASVLGHPTDLRDVNQIDSARSVAAA